MQTASEAVGGANRRVAFLQLYEEHKDSEGAVNDAVGMRKEVIARLKTDGFNADSFKMMLRAEDQSGERREAIFAAFQEMMLYIGKPLGAVEPVSPTEPSADELGTISQVQQGRVDEAGYLAGKNNWNRDQNPWSPGTLLAQVWDVGWKRGMEELAQAGEGARPRGRPKGSRNKTKDNIGDTAGSA